MVKRAAKAKTAASVKITIDDDESVAAAKPKARAKPKAKPSEGLTKPEGEGLAKAESQEETKAKGKKKATAKTPAKTTADLHDTDATESKKKRVVMQVSQKEHVKMRSMWAGSKENQTLETYVLSKDEDDCLIFEPKELFYPPALLKIIDEIIVNAIDHAVVYPKSVKDINISVTEKGEICVWNNGPGIDIKKVKTADGKELWAPEMIFTQFLAGSNFQSEESVVGGQNGIGAKLTVIYSKVFTVETVDADAKKLYRQTYRNGMDVIEEPIIEESKSKPYTSIKFLPDYEFLKIDATKFYDTLYQLVEARAWQAAAFTTATVRFNDLDLPLKDFEQFCGMFPTNGVTMYTFQSEKFPKFPWQVGLGISNGKEFAVSLINGIFVSKGGTHIQHIQNKIVANVKTKLEKLLKETKQKFNKNILLNNISIFVKGSIVNPEFHGQVKESIANAIETFADYDMSQTQWNSFWKSVADFIQDEFMKRMVGDDSQRIKKRVNVSKYIEAKYCASKKYALDCGLILVEGSSAQGTVKKGLLGQIESSPKFNFEWFGIFETGGVIANGMKSGIQPPAKKAIKLKLNAGGKIIIEEKQDALSIDESANGSSNGSIIGENDQLENNSVTDDSYDLMELDEEKKLPADAITPAETTAAETTDGITNNIDEVADDIWGEEKGSKFMIDLVNNPHVRPAPKETLKKNARIKALMEVLGLNFAKTYETAEDFKTLRYGFIVGVLDQDLDGFNIFGLIATFIITYWPALAKRGFIRRINTPLIRAQLGKKTIEFYSENHFDNWFKTQPEATQKTAKIKYYKGLAGHEDSNGEIKAMFSNVWDKICVYEMDEKTIKYMQIYYGMKTKPRKIMLRLPPPPRPKVSKVATFTQHFNIDVREFQRDTITRRIKRVTDGLIDSWGKILHIVLKRGGEFDKINKIAADVLKHTAYAHGDVSLCDSIARLAQGGPMARSFPLLKKWGNFGSRAKSYRDVGQARYISAANNYKLNNKLFRDEDLYVLDYNFSEGKMQEPVSFCPIIPLAILESFMIPGTGWNQVIHARHIDDVLDNIRAMIKGEIGHCRPLRYWLKDFHGTLISPYVPKKDQKKLTEEKYPALNDQKEYYVGSYEYDATENLLRITELPIGICSDDYVNGSEKQRKSEDCGGLVNDPWVDSVNDYSTDEKINIEVHLKEGAEKGISEQKVKGGAYKYAGKDPFIEYFKLKKSINHKLNFVNECGVLMEFKSYEDVFDYWFHYRKAMYAKRLERELIILKAKLLIYKNMQRFCAERDNYNITGKTTLNEFYQLLEKNKYAKLNKSYVFEPRHISTEELFQKIYQDTEDSYDYIMDLKMREMTKTSFDDRAQKIKDIEERLLFIEAKDNRFIGANVWLKELDELEKVIRDGLATNWFSEKGIEYISGETIEDQPNGSPIIATVTKTRKSSKKSAATKTVARKIKI